MQPPKYLVDLFIETLEWYKQLRVELDNLEGFLDNCKKSNDVVSEKFSNYDKIVSMVLRGIDFINDSTIDSLIQVCDKQAIEKSLNVSGNHPIKHIPTSKVQSIEQGQLLLQALVTYESNLGIKGVFVRCQFLLWERSALTMLKNIHSCHQPQLVSLKQAKDFLHIVENTYNEIQCQGLGHTSLVDSVYRKAYLPLKDHILQSEKLEEESHTYILSLEIHEFKIISTQELTDFVTNLKATRTKIKCNVLKIDDSIEARVNRCLRNLVWILSLSSYETIFVPSIDVTGLSSLLISCTKEDPATNRSDSKEHLSNSKQLTWQTLNGLYDKMPKLDIEDGSSNPFGLDALLRKVCTNLTTLKSAGDEWEAKVLSKLPLSSRGKRRRQQVVSSGATKKVENNKADVTIKELKDLTNNNILHYVSIILTKIQEINISIASSLIVLLLILFRFFVVVSKVSLPLEPVVRQIYEGTVTVETELNKLLTFDIYSDKVDRIPIPDTLSLIGPRGEFYLKKICGNSSYKEMQNRLTAMVASCDELLADTPETRTIRWLSNAINWIENIASKLTIGHRGKMQLSSEDAEDLVVMGSKIFLEIEDIIKRCMIKYKIVLYANKQTRYFTVTIARGGAIHSIGGYVLRWVEFCFNGLRGDIYLASQLEQKLQSYCPENNDSVSTTSEKLSELVEEAEEDLLIPPTREVMENVYNVLRSSNIAIQNNKEKKSDSTIHFSHELIDNWNEDVHSVATKK